MWIEIGKLAVSIQDTNRLCCSIGRLVLTATYHIALRSCHALGTTPAVLQVQTLAQVIVIDSCLWHNGSLFIQIGTPCRNKFRGLSESMSADPVKATAGQAFVIASRNSVHLIIEHICFTSLTLPLLH